MEPYFKVPFFYDTLFGDLDDGTGTFFFDQVDDLILEFRTGYVPDAITMPLKSSKSRYIYGKRGSYYAQKETKTDRWKGA